VRPPTDRVREAVFNLLRQLVPGRPVFDLFAGSGAFGLESLSRGANHATLVESEPRVAAIMRKNIAHLRYEHATTVIVADVFRWVERVHRWPTDPAIVLVAPPYVYFKDRPDDLGSLWATLVRVMPDDTAIVIQAPQDFTSAELPAGQDWELRRYGQTQVVICQTVKANPPEPSSVQPEQPI